MAQFRNITKQQAKINRANYTSPDFDMGAALDKFIDEYDYHSDPSHSAKMMSAHGKKLLISIWTQWVAFEEATAEHVGGFSAWDSLGEMTAAEQMENFHSYLGGFVESMMEDIKKTEVEA